MAVNIDLLDALSNCKLGPFMTLLNKHEGPVGDIQVDENEHILTSALKYALNSEMYNLDEFVRRLRYVELLFTRMSQDEGADRAGLIEARAYVSNLINVADPTDTSKFSVIFNQRLASLNKIVERPLECQPMNPVSKNAFVVGGFGIQDGQFVPVGEEPGSSL